MWLARWVLVCVLIYHISCSVPACSAERARCCNVGEYENHVSTYVLVLVWFGMFFLFNSYWTVASFNYQKIFNGSIAAGFGGSNGNGVRWPVDFYSFFLYLCICMYVCGGGLCQRRQSIFSFYQHNQSSKIVNCHNQAKQSREIYFKMQFT